MPITDKQRLERRKFLGSSDMAAVLGVSPFSTAYDVWAEKTGKLTDEAESAVMTAGNMFEEGVLTWAQGQLGELINKNVIRHVENTHLASHPDAELKKTGEPVEAKTSGLYGPTPFPWGDAGTDEVADHIIVQGHVHMMAMKSEVCHIPAFIGGRGFAMFHVKLDSEVEIAILEAADSFWHSHVQADLPPTNVDGTMRYLRRIKRVPDKVVEVPLATVEMWEKAKAKALRAKRIADDLKAALLTRLGIAEAGSLADGRLLTYFKQNRAGYSVKPSEYRVLRVRKA